MRGIYVSADQWVSPRVGVFGRYGIGNSGPGALFFGPVRTSYSGGIQWRFAGEGVQQPVAKVVTAFDRPCIPADCVATRSHTPGMLPHRALSGGRRNGLGARATFTTDCQDSALGLAFSQAFGISDAESPASEKVLEAYYRWQVTRNFAFTPDFHPVFGSGGRSAKGTQGVLGARVHVSF